MLCIDQPSGIEHFDLSGTGNNMLSLNGEVAVDATGGTKPLTSILDSVLTDGDAEDTIVVDSSLAKTGAVTTRAHIYSAFESADNGTKVFFDDDVAITVD